MKIWRGTVSTTLMSMTVTTRAKTRSPARLVSTVMTIKTRERISAVTPTITIGGRRVRGLIVAPVNTRGGSSLPVVGAGSRSRCQRGPHSGSPALLAEARSADPEDGDDAGQEAADREGDADDQVGADAEQAGHREVVGGGAQGDADDRAAQQDREHDQGDDADGETGEVHDPEPEATQGNTLDEKPRQSHGLGSR